MAPNNDADVKLMLAIIGSAENIKTDNEKLANIIGGTTANAIRQRVAKIKTQAKAVLEGSGPDSAFSESAAKDGKNTTKKDSGGKSTSVNNGDGVVDDEEVATPAPTRKKRATNEKGKGNGTPRGKKVKEEATEEDGEESPAKRVKTETDRGAEV